MQTQGNLHTWFLKLHMWSRLLYLPNGSLHNCSMKTHFQNPSTEGTKRLNQLYIPPAEQTSGYAYVTATTVFSKESNKFICKPAKLKLKFIEVLDLINILNTMLSRNSTINLLKKNLQVFETADYLQLTRFVS